MSVGEQQRLGLGRVRGMVILEDEATSARDEASLYARLRAGAPPSSASPTAPRCCAITPMCCTTGGGGRGSARGGEFSSLIGPAAAVAEDTSRGAGCGGGLDWLTTSRVPSYGVRTPIRSPCAQGLLGRLGIRRRQMHGERQDPERSPLAVDVHRIYHTACHGSPSPCN